MQSCESTLKTKAGYILSTQPCIWVERLCQLSLINKLEYITLFLLIQAKRMTLFQIPLGATRAIVMQLGFDSRTSDFMPQILIKLQDPFFDQRKADNSSFILVKEWFL